MLVEMVLKSRCVLKCLCGIYGPCPVFPSMQCNSQCSGTSRVLMPESFSLFLKVSSVGVMEFLPLM
jgi:hypothetical protein